MHDNKGKTHTQEHFQTEFSLRSVFFYIRSYSSRFFSRKETFNQSILFRR